MIDDPEWFTDTYLYGIGWIYDKQKFDFIKEKIKNPDVMKSIYQRFGILNLFSILRLSGTYKLELEKYEEWLIAKILFELAKVEGYDKILFCSLNGK